MSEENNKQKTCIKSYSNISPYSSHFSQAQTLLVTVFRTNIRWNSSWELYIWTETHSFENKMSESRSRRKSVMSTSSRSLSRKGKRKKKYEKRWFYLKSLTYLSTLSCGFYSDALLDFETKGLHRTGWWLDGWLSF